MNKKKQASVHFLLWAKQTKTSQRKQKQATAFFSSKHFLLWNRQPEANKNTKHNAKYHVRTFLPEGQASSSKQKQTEAMLKTNDPLLLLDQASRSKQQKAKSRYLGTKTNISCFGATDPKQTESKKQQCSEKNSQSVIWNKQ